MSLHDRVKGSITALITPMKNGAVDEAAFRRFVEWQIAEGTHGLVPCGTTGESPTLSHDEHMRVVEICAETARGRVPVIAGAGSNSTEEAIGLTRHAKEVGADAVLSVAPYYNKPTQEGIYRHFAAIAEAVDIPLIIYNIPGRSVVEISVETMGRLTRIANVIGTKDATGNVGRLTRERAVVRQDYIALSGDDCTALGYAAHGGHGSISVTSNIAPRLMADFHNHCLAGEFAKAAVIQDKTMALHDALFIEASPAPTKYAASLLGFCTEDVRLPIIPVSEPTKLKIREAMTRAGIAFN